MRPTSVGQLPEPLHSLSSTAATTCPVCVLGGWLQLYLAQSDQNQAHQSGFLYQVIILYLTGSGLQTDNAEQMNKLQILKFEI